MKKGSKEEMMSLWSKFLKPKPLWKKIEEKKVKEVESMTILMEEDVDMAKEEEEEEFVTIVIIMK